ncbi:hypothetical protein HDA35_004634 [Micromonospora purpureochromogenes]|uniref:SprT-like family protein n=2 Tax=Micromonospora purpureochromogenes TaxID=47872 RepID=A0ABX2RQL6_9ACTN|nr:hypothetical protein [Micromonospora purpureochromogenes]
MSTAAHITHVTRTCQDSVSTAALVGALESAWSAIRDRHPEIPAAVLVVGSGSPTKANQGMKWGHFAALRWQAGDNQLPEILISGEGLSREPEAVFTTLLHEATHALADARGIQDTSRQGRWHNKKFSTLAAELGMSTTKDDKLGYSPCTLTDLTRARYRAVIADLGEALRFYRHPEPTGEGKTRTNNNNGVSCECECPRKLRISKATFEEGPIVCALCGAAFLPEDIDRDTYEHPTFGTGTAAGDGRADDDSEDPMVFYDPTGERYGLPTYPFKFAPDGLLTRRQLRTRNLRPGGQEPAAQILWRRGKRVAYLYRLDLARPKRTATAAQRAAIDKALTARRTCPICGEVKPYYIPRRTGTCLDCP